MHVVTKILLVSTLISQAMAADSGLIVLGSGAPYPKPNAEIFTAVEAKLRSAGRPPENYHARIDVCDPDACAVAVFSRDIVVDPREPGIIKPCPGNYCATMTYSKKLKSISRGVVWK
jgi:hypothetical protein